MNHLTRTTPLLGLVRDATGKNVWLTYPGDSHLLTVAGTRTGKGRCVILPNLVTYAGSVIVLDPKGENCIETAQWREANGQAVHVFDPFGVVPDHLLPTSGRASFNPLDLVRSSPSPITVAMLIAEAMIIPSERDPHWGQAAQALFAAYIMHVAFSEDFEPDEVDEAEGFPDPAPRNLRTAWKCFTSPDLAEKVLQRLLLSDDPFVAAQALRVIEGVKTGGQEVSSIRNTLYTQCNISFSEPAVVAALDYSTIDFGLLSHVPTSVYIVLPGWATPNHKRFMRLLLNCAMAQVEMGGLPPGGSHMRETPATLFIMDEFATLGRMDSIVESMGRMAGYGIKFWPFVQNISQLKKQNMYGDGWTDIAGNTGVLQYFGGTNCLETAEYLSKLSGETTRVQDSQSVSTKTDAGVGTSYNKFQRMLFTRDEIANLPCDPKNRTGTQLAIYTGKRSVDPAIVSMTYIDRDFPDFQAFKAARKKPPPPGRMAWCERCQMEVEPRPKPIVPGAGFQMADAEECSRCGWHLDDGAGGPRSKAHQFRA